MTGKLYVAGVGPGNLDYLAPAALKMIVASDLLIGGARNLQLFQHLGKATLELRANLETICQYIALHHREQRITVLASGDPGVFSILQTLRRALPEVEIEVAPGISSVQYFSSKLGIPWEDWRLVSLHGREGTDLALELQNYSRVCVFTGGSNSPDRICSQFSAVLQGWRVTVGENLASPEERMIQGTAAQIAGLTFTGLALVFLERLEAAQRQVWPYVTPGLPDGLMVRGQVPMTKEEVRAVAVAKLRLQANSIVYDIGAGTGSVSLECALLCPQGRVFAIEKNPEALQLIKENRQRFGRANLELVAGEAPEILEALPSPDRIFIGGTGGRLRGLMDWLAALPVRPRVVLTAVTLETIWEAVTLLEQAGFADVELVNIAVTRYEKVAGRRMAQALNPVGIVSAGEGGTGWPEFCTESESAPGIRSC